MPGDERHFAVVHSPGPQGEPVVLHAALPAEDVTMVFASELLRLRATKATGDLMVYRTDTSTITLRQPIAVVVEGNARG